MFIAHLILLALTSFVICDDHANHSIESRNVYADIGEPANLTCVQPSANRTLSCDWARLDSNGTKNLDLAQASLTEAEEGRIKYVGNGENACSFELRNVQEEDLTSWKGTFGFKQDEDNQTYKICQVKLIEKVAPKFIQIQNKLDLETLIDEDGSGNNTVTIKCCADKKAAPPPDLTFIFDGQLVQNTSYDEEESCLTWPNATFYWGDNHKELNCSLKHPTTDDLMDSMTLNVLYGPILLEVKQEYFTVTANPPPQFTPDTHFKIQKQSEKDNVWAVFPTAFTQEEQTFNVTVSNVYKTVFVPLQIPALTTTTTELPTSTVTTFTTSKAPTTTTHTSEKPVSPQSAKKWSAFKVVLLVCGVVIAVVLMTLLMIFVGYKKGFFGSALLIPKPDYPEEDTEPAVLFQANPIQP